MSLKLDLISYARLAIQVVDVSEVGWPTRDPFRGGVVGSRFDLHKFKPIISKVLTEH